MKKNINKINLAILYCIVYTFAIIPFIIWMIYAECNKFIIYNSPIWAFVCFILPLSTTIGFWKCIKFISRIDE